MTSKTFISLADFQGHGSTNYFMIHHGFRVAKSIADADIIIFNGGVDIGTELYKEKPILGVPLQASNRDLNEKALFKDYAGSGKLFFGICRGAQLLNVLNGGTLWQDVNKHGQNHMVTLCETEQLLEVTSTHHQMMRPNLSSGVVLAKAEESTRKCTATEEIVGLDSDGDIEIVWYPKTRSLCVQGHPEYVPDSLFAEYTVGLIHKYMKEEVDA